MAEEKKRDHERLEKVTSGKVTRAKQSKTRKFANLFLDDDIESIKDYAIEELIVPGISNWILDILAMLLPGANRRSGSGGRRADREDYTSYSKGSRSSRSKYAEERGRRRYKTAGDVYDVIFETRMDADKVLSELDYYARKFGQATVEDFYDAAGVSSDNYMNDDFGWKLDDIRNAYISHSRGGYVIVLPPAVELD